MFGKIKRYSEFFFIISHRKDSYAVPRNVYQYCLAKYIKYLYCINCSSNWLCLSWLIGRLLIVIILVVVCKFRWLSWYEWFVLIATLCILVKWKDLLNAGQFTFGISHIILGLSRSCALILWIPVILWFQLCLWFLLHISKIEINIIEILRWHSY